MFRNCKTIIATVVLFLSTLSGCVLIDLEIPLLYESSEKCEFDLPDIYLQRVEEFPPFARVGKQIIVGRVANAAGRVKAKILTSDSVSDWVASALITEFQMCNAEVTPVEEISPHGLTVAVTIERVFVLTGTAVIEGEINLYSEGKIIHKENISTSSRETTDRLNVATGEALALKNAMRGFIHSALTVVKSVIKQTSKRDD